MEEYGYLQGMDEKIRKNIERDGKIYLMPTAVYSTGIAVNLKLLAEAGYVEADGTPHQPATFEELAQMAADIDFIVAFSRRMADAKLCPVAREMPDNMKEKLDEYLMRKRPKNA